MQQKHNHILSKNNSAYLNDYSINQTLNNSKYWQINDYLNGKSYVAEARQRIGGTSTAEERLFKVMLTKLH